MSASMNSIAWNSAIARPNWRRSVAKASASSRHRCDAPTVRAPIISRSSTNQSFVSSNPCPTSPSTRSSPTRTSSNAIDRVLEDERVGVLRGPHQPHAGRVLVDEEDRRLRRVPVDVRVHQEEVRDIAARDVPLLAAQHPVGAVSRGGRGDHRDVGARVGLGDRVGVPAFPRARRPQEPLLLFLRAGRQRDRRAPRDVPQRARHVAPLLLHEHHLEGVEPATAVGLGVVDRMELPVEHRPFRGGGTRGREAVVLLAFELERPQHLLGEPARFVLQRGVTLGQSHVHRGSLLQGRVRAGV